MDTVSHRVHASTDKWGTNRPLVPKVPIAIYHANDGAYSTPAAKIFFNSSTNGGTYFCVIRQSVSSSMRR